MSAQNGDGAEEPAGIMDDPAGDHVNLLVKIGTLQVRLDDLMPRYAQLYQECERLRAENDALREGAAEALGEKLSMSGGG